VNAALLLAGGASQRMGRDKASLLVEGVPMVVRVAHTLRKAGHRPILIAVRDGQQRREIGGLLAHLTDVEYLLDESVERGSKPALMSALSQCHAMGIERIQLAPCDLPWVEAEVFIRLQAIEAKIVIPRSTHLEPLLANIEVAAVIQAIQNAPRRSGLQDLMRGVPHRIIDMQDLGEACFRNLNRPSDLT